jgi:hypothetical protein
VSGEIAIDFGGQIAVNVGGENRRCPSSFTGSFFCDAEKLTLQADAYVGASRTATTSRPCWARAMPP